VGKQVAEKLRFSSKSVLVGVFLSVLINFLGGFISILPSRRALVRVPEALELDLPRALTHDRPEVSNLDQVVDGCRER